MPAQVLIELMTASPEVSLRAPNRKSTATTCPVKGRLSQELSTVTETVASLQSHLDKPQTVMALVHPECLRFELQGVLARKSALEQEYEQHLTAHGC
jgi:hypothetical protein